ncbi:hypothetical protein [Virgibacillus dokdonensis]
MVEEKQRRLLSYDLLTSQVFLMGAIMMCFLGIDGGGAKAKGRA